MTGSMGSISADRESLSGANSRRRIAPLVSRQSGCSSDAKRHSQEGDSHRGAAGHGRNGDNPAHYWRASHLRRLFFRYRVFLEHRARIVKKGRVLSDAEYTFWRLQTRARRQLSAPSALLSSSRAETAPFRVELACGGVEAKKCERAATPGDQRHLGSQSTPS